MYSLVNEIIFLSLCSYWHCYSMRQVRHEKYKFLLWNEMLLTWPFELSDNDFQLSWSTPFNHVLSLIVLTQVKSGQLPSLSTPDASYLLAHRRWIIQTLKSKASDEKQLLFNLNHFLVMCFRHYLQDRYLWTLWTVQLLLMTLRSLNRQLCMVSGSSVQLSKYLYMTLFLPWFIYPTWIFIYLACPVMHASILLLVLLAAMVSAKGKVFALRTSKRPN